jgi:hypothetical protein
VVVGSDCEDSVLVVGFGPTVEVMLGHRGVVTEVELPAGVSVGVGERDEVCMGIDAVLNVAFVVTFVVGTLDTGIVIVGVLELVSVVDVGPVGLIGMLYEVVVTFVVEFPRLGSTLLIVGIETLGTVGMVIVGRSPPVLEVVVVVPPVLGLAVVVPVVVVVVVSTVDSLVDDCVDVADDVLPMTLGINPLEPNKLDMTLGRTPSVVEVVDVAVGVVVSVVVGVVVICVVDTVEVEVLVLL